MHRRSVAGGSAGMEATSGQSRLPTAANRPAADRPPPSTRRLPAVVYDTRRGARHRDGERGDDAAAGQSLPHTPGSGRGGGAAGGVTHGCGRAAARRLRALCSASVLPPSLSLPSSPACLSLATSLSFSLPASPPPLPPPPSLSRSADLPDPCCAAPCFYAQLSPVADMGADRTKLATSPLASPATSPTRALLSRRSIRYLLCRPPHPRCGTDFLSCVLAALSENPADRSPPFFHDTAACDRLGRAAPAD